MSEREVASPEGEEYHGWANRPSWIVHQWLSADPDTAATARGILKNAGDVLDGAEDLRTWIEEGNPLSHEASLYTDLLGWALSAVTWVDVAEPFAPDPEPDGRPNVPSDSGGPLAVHPSTQPGN